MPPSPREVAPPKAVTEGVRPCARIQKLPVPVDYMIFSDDRRSLSKAKAHAGGDSLSRLAAAAPSEREP